MADTKTINTTAGNFEARLVVYRDWTTQGNGNWRLFWENMSDEGCGVNDESTVTGQPFFKTMKDAIARGESKYGITAVKRVY